MPDAARVGDDHTCSNSQPKAHVGGPIDAPCSPDVETNGKDQARATDTAMCTGVGLKNFIVTGSSTVDINGKMAARKTDKTMHPHGHIKAGSPNVVIGGARAGATLGNPDKGAEACKKAAKGRTSGATAQTYNNCGVESDRQIINQATGKNLSEDGLLQDAQAHGEASTGPNPMDNGFTSTPTITSILNRNGVPASQQSGSMDNISEAVANGNGVVTVHDTSILWGSGPAAGHAVTVTGLEYDKNGNLSKVIYNDTGTGKCKSSLPAKRFQKSLIPGQPAIVTDKPVW